MNRVLILLLAAFLLSLGFAVWAMLGSAEAPAYPAPVVQGFMDRCIQSGRDQHTCSCVLNEMQRRYTLEQSIRLGLQFQGTGQVPAELADTVARCGR